MAPIYFREEEVRNITNWSLHLLWFISNDFATRKYFRTKIKKLPSKFREVNFLLKTFFLLKSFFHFQERKASFFIVKASLILRSKNLNFLLFFQKSLFASFKLLFLKKSLFPSQNLLTSFSLPQNLYLLLSSFFFFFKSLLPSLNLLSCLSPLQKPTKVCICFYQASFGQTGSEK